MHSQVSQAGLNPQCGIPTFALGVEKGNGCASISSLARELEAPLRSAADKVATRSAWGLTSHLGQRPFGVVAFPPTLLSATTYIYQSIPLLSACCSTADLRCDVDRRSGRSTCKYVRLA